ncbi:MAG: TetR/AcrR family transcriptional regulator [Herpetosiphonaceae bacterium]|nr:TetR/AcrR family transcriptional regulator [Herpetosiphonaceae bacterium]
MSRPTWHERQRQFREDAILDAAYDLMLEQSYADMSMDELAARVGISKATLYQHFASKEDLAVNVIVRSMQRTEEEIRSVDPALPAIDQLKQAMQRGIERKANTWATRMMVMPTTVVQHPRFQAQHQHMMAEIAKLVEAAKSEGDVVNDIPTPVIVKALSSLFRNDYEEALRASCCSPQQFSKALVSIMFDGIRTGREAKEALGQD